MTKNRNIYQTSLSLSIARFIAVVIKAKKSSDEKIAEIQIPVDERGDRWSAETAAIG